MVEECAPGGPPEQKACAVQLDSNRAVLLLQQGCVALTLLRCKRVSVSFFAMSLESNGLSERVTWLGTL